MNAPLLSRALVLLAVAAAALTTAGTASAASTTFAGTATTGGCSGFLVRSPASRPGDPAPVLTNGHCFAGTRPVPGEVLADRPTNTPVHLLDAAGAPAAVVVATKALYVGMTGTDVTLYRLDRTYAGLDRDYQVRPLPLATQRPARGPRSRSFPGRWNRSTHAGWTGSSTACSSPGTRRPTCCGTRRSARRSRARRGRRWSTSRPGR
ncbi:hypothetical protein [Amycolatopsis sp. FDAARGOS 1241]|uniref:hypothetical protein n=1 Tax=Amycolatopsis sp. FDAARGOS 1241 TaxID=2778070 RepID=UPI001951571F|nr:hypothetical protein [Amycolatopsis sp. FDAARGOS 1241]QRP47753.1 hypothetical protein I6J71_07470 [Amycolatopsis sp. FDAARGOS 1241]